MATPQLSSYASGTSDVPLLGETIGANLERTVARFGDREALVDVPERPPLDLRRAGRRRRRASPAGCSRLGVAKGDRVGIWAPNCAEWVLVQYATAKIGAILVNINPAYRTHELAYVLNQSGVTVLVIAPSFKTSDYVAMVEEVRGDCPALRDVVLHRHPVLGRAGRRRRRRRRGRACGRATAELSCDDPINIQYTSGTTGFPKGATLSHHNILNNGYFVGRACAATPRRTGSACRCPSTTASAW